MCQVQGPFTPNVSVKQGCDNAIDICFIENNEVIQEWVATHSGATLFVTSHIHSTIGGYVFTGVCLLIGVCTPGLWSLILS